MAIMSESKPSILSYAAIESPNHKFRVVALVLIAVAWSVMVAGVVRTNHLDVSRWGTDTSIAEAITVDKYRAAFFRPYIFAAAQFDLLALGIAIWALVRARRENRTAWIVVMVLCALSAVYHGWELIVVQLWLST